MFRWSLRLRVVAALTCDRRSTPLIAACREWTTVCVHSRRPDTDAPARGHVAPNPYGHARQRPAETAWTGPRDSAGCAPNSSTAAHAPGWSPGANRSPKEKRAAFADEDYWGRPVPGFGDPAGAAAGRRAGAGRPRRQPHRADVHRRPQRRLALRRAASHRLRQPAQATHVDDGLELTDCWVTSPVKCAPPQNKPTTERTRPLPPVVRPARSPRSRVQVVVALGGFGWHVTLQAFGWDTRLKPKFGHGAEAPLPGSDLLPHGATLLGSYHVSQQNTFTGRLTEPMLDSVFLRAKEILANSGS